MPETGVVLQEYPGDHVAEVKAIKQAVRPECNGCSTAEFTPRRLGKVVLEGKMSLENAQKWAASCSGPYDGTCHHQWPLKNT